MKKLIILLLLIPVFCKAPENRTLFIEAPVKIDPYDRILEAMSFVESSHNPFAYNASEGSCGLWQIRQIRLTDYFNRTGIKYYPYEMFEVAKAEEVIRFYTKIYGVYRIKDFILSWNCQSQEYLKRVINQLNR